MNKWKHTNPGNLKIARNNSGLTTREATDKVCGKNRKEDKVLELEEGIDLPTFKQLDKLAKLYEVSWLLLGKEYPLKKHRRIPSFRRTAANERNANCSKFINFLIQRQRFLEAALQCEGVLKNPNTGSIKYAKQSPAAVAAKITEVLKYKVETIHKSPAEHLKHLISLVEDQGVFVMKTLSYWPIPKEFMQGLYLHNAYAPIIALNRADDKRSQIFTLANEVVHMFIKREGIGDIDFRNSSSDSSTDKAERFCNEVAANLLLPEELFSQPSYDYDDIKEISQQHQVSQLFVFYRLNGLGLIEIGQINDIKQRAETAPEPKAAKNDSWTGCGYINTMKDSNGFLFTDLLTSLYFEEKLSPAATINILRLSIESISD